MPDTSAFPGKIVYAGKNCVIWYEPKLSDFAEIAMGPELLAAAMECATEEALPYALAISPERLGSYKRSWKVEPGVWTSRKTMLTRVVAKLINTHPESVWVEWGGSKKKPEYRKRGQHILRQVLEHLAAGNEPGAGDID